MKTRRDPYLCAPDSVRLPPLKPITAHTPETLRAFEQRIVAHFASGKLPCLIHLSGGNEEQLIRLFREIQPEDWVFSTHRNHYHALLKGIPEATLEAAILRGDSMFVFSKEHRFFTSSILAGTCAIAAGVAWDIRQEFIRTTPAPLPAHSGWLPERREPHVWCFLGDGASENGHFAEAVCFVGGHDLPCTFIIEDNDRQVDTDKRTRRGEHHDELGHYIQWPTCVRGYRYRATFPHGGAGLKPGSVTFNPEAITRLRPVS